MLSEEPHAIVNWKNKSHRRTIIYRAYEFPKLREHRTYTHIKQTVQAEKQNFTGKNKTNLGLYTIIVNIKLKYWPINAVFNVCPPIYLMFTVYSRTNRKIHSRANLRAFTIFYYQRND